MSDPNIDCVCVKGARMLQCFVRMCLFLNATQTSSHPECLIPMGGEIADSDWIVSPDSVVYLHILFSKKLCKKSGNDANTPKNVVLNSVLHGTAYKGGMFVLKLMTLCLALF